MARSRRSSRPRRSAAISAWLAAQPVPAGAKPAAGFAAPLPIACGGVPATARPGRRDEAAPGPRHRRPRGARRAASRSPALVAWLNLLGEERLGPAPPRVAASAELVARGEALTRAGDCIGCHTARGGAPYAGGRAIETPFGNVYASNLTPDPDTGLGRWSADEFWRALHHGRSKSGRLLYPAFPYPNYTRVVARRCRRDVRLPAEPAGGGAAEPRAHARAFRSARRRRSRSGARSTSGPAAHVDDPARSAEWNRGAYLVEGLGHCNACHSARNALGATRGTLDLQGGLIPVQNWYAPSLASPREASVAGWPKHEVVQLLQDRRSRRRASSWGR